MGESFFASWHLGLKLGLRACSSGTGPPHHGVTAVPPGIPSLLFLLFTLRRVLTHLPSWDYGLVSPGPSEQPVLVGKLLGFCIKLRLQSGGCRGMKHPVFRVESVGCPPRADTGKSLSSLGLKNCPYIRSQLCHVFLIV